jgi:hypothetical protein
MYRITGTVCQHNAVNKYINNIRNIDLNENWSRWRRVVSCGRTNRDRDRQTQTERERERERDRQTDLQKT